MIDREAGGARISLPKRLEPISLFSKSDLVSLAVVGSTISFKLHSNPTEKSCRLRKSQINDQLVAVPGGRAFLVGSHASPGQECPGHFFSRLAILTRRLFLPAGGTRASGSAAICRPLFRP